MDNAAQFLNHLVGHWELNGLMGQTPLHQSVEAQWVLGGLFVEMHIQSVIPVGDQKPYEAIYHIGYATQTDTYVMHLLDTFGVSTACIVGLGKREGDSIPFVFAYESGPFINRFTWDSASQTWTFEQTYLENGTVQPFANKRMTRVPAFL